LTWGGTLHRLFFIDAAARPKIESQRRTILEGSQEWDILYASTTTKK